MGKIGSPAVPKTAAPQGHRSSNLLPSAKILSRDVPGRAACFQTKRMGFESSSRRQRRARQMVSQHTANVPSVHARLGSIPRLSAKLVSKKVRVSGGYGWPRLPVEQSAPLERPGSNPGTPTTRPRSPTGRGNRLKIGKVWVRIPAGPPPVLRRSYYRLLLRTRRIGRGRNLRPLDPKAVQIFAQTIGIVRGRFAPA